MTNEEILFEMRQLQIEFLAFMNFSEEFLPVESAKLQALAEFLPPEKLELHLRSALSAYNRFLDLASTLREGLEMRLERLKIEARKGENENGD